MPDSWDGRWANAVFSLEERDRRWAAVRAAMAADGLFALVCLPSTINHDRGQASARYLTQLGENSEEVTCVLPLEGEVTTWQLRAGVYPGSSWITDNRRAGRTYGRAVSTRLHELGLTNQAIGVVGLTGGLYASVREPEGETNHGSLMILREAFPQASFVSATDLVGRLRYRKSAEEIELLRKGTTIAEAMFRAQVAEARPGAWERAVYAAMVGEAGRRMASFPFMVGWISGPLGNTYHRVEQPTFRTLQPGDVVVNEIEGRWGGYIAQIDTTLSIGRAPQDLKDGHALAVECFNRVLAAMKPGVTFGDLARVGEVAGMGGRGHARVTIHGRGTGDDGPLFTASGRSEAIMRMELVEGASFVVKPSTEVDGKPDYGRWGDTVVVTASGAQRLGTRSQELAEAT
jgi:Xaa-Pro aminopeptidase